MMVFVEIEDISGYPTCAFLNTITDRFEENALGQHVFDSPYEIEEHPQAGRLKALIPNGFWDKRNER